MLGMNKWVTPNPCYSCTSLTHSFSHSFIQQICIDHTAPGAGGNGEESGPHSFPWRADSLVGVTDLNPIIFTESQNIKDFRNPLLLKMRRERPRKVWSSCHPAYPQSSASPVSLLPVPSSDHHKMRTGSSIHGCESRVEPYENVLILQKQWNISHSTWF